jgi:periplasmic protein TonB
MSALIYRPNKKWRFSVALLAAALIHLGAIAFANAHRAELPTATGFPNEPAEISIEPANPDLGPPPAFDSLRTPFAIDELYVENTATPPPVRPRLSKSTPLVRPPATAAVRRSLNLSSAKALAVSAPRPEYPFEARRQKITGSGVAILSVDSGSGNVTDVTMSQSTGSAFLDNAAIAGFRRWRFKTGSVSNVTCPVTFTLSGASY